jgi:mRNA-degrading endonuclease toxin of MazEF toxin-antitoxin module
MIDSGDIVIADLQGERRQHVLVISTARFHEHTGRAIVAPDVALSPLDDEMPWRIVIDGRPFAVDLLRSIPVDRLLDRAGRAPAVAVRAARHAIRAIT